MAAPAPFPVPGRFTHGDHMDQRFDSPAQAIADIPDGATVAIAGFGLMHGFATSLIVALRDQGTKDLCVVCNSRGASGEAREQILAENRQISRLIASFSGRPGKGRIGNPMGFRGVWLTPGAAVDRRF